MKHKTNLIILALAALAVIGYVVYRQSSDAAPYDSFALVMDRLRGPGQWSAQSHEESENGLAVNGLTFPASFSLVGRFDGDERDGLVRLDSLFIKKLPPRDRLEKLLALADWQNQPETGLVRAVRLEGFHWRETRPEGNEIKIEELNLGGLKLARAAPDAPAGEAGFRKALRLASLDCKNLLKIVKEPEVETAFVLDSAAFEGLDFDVDIPPELVKLAKPGSGGFPYTWVAMNAKSLKTNGLEQNFLGLAPESSCLNQEVPCLAPAAPFKLNLSLAALEETDFKAFKSVGSLKLTDLQVRLTTGQGQEFSLDLAGGSLSGLDLTDYLGRLLAGLAEARDNPEEAESLLAGQFTLADFFVCPISLEDAALTGLKMELAGLASIKAAEIKTVGPYMAGEIPASARSWTKGLEISLPGDPQAEPGTPGRDIYEFSRTLGRTNFALEAEGDSSYEPRTGQWTTRLSRLSVSELFDLSSSHTWSGLTRDRLEKFKKTPLAALYMAAFDPDDLWGAAAINTLNIKYADLGLVDTIFNFQAREEGNETGAELKQRSMAEVGLMLAIIGARYLKNTEDLSRPILDFLKSPQSLEMDMKASPPLALAGLIQGLNTEPSALLDSLNLTFSANGQAGSPLRFVPGLGEPGLEMRDSSD
jgi:hypothetical protein